MNAWVKSLLAAGIGAAAGAGATALTPAGFDWRAVLVAGGVAVFAYLAKSPLPDNDTFRR